jgi:hypothetical protein
MYAAALCGIVINRDNYPRSFDIYLRSHGMGLHEHVGSHLKPKFQQSALSLLEIALQLSTVRWDHKTLLARQAASGTPLPEVWVSAPLCFQRRGSTLLMVPRWHTRWLRLSSRLGQIYSLRPL